MGLLRRGASLGPRRRIGIKREIGALADEREEILRDLGGLALEMYRRERIDDGLLLDRAGELAELEQRMGSLRRALDEGVTPEEVGRA